MDDVVLVSDQEGKLILGRVCIFGIVPLITFDSFKELRKFAMGILGCCEYFSPEVPEVFSEAFNEEDKNGN